MTFCVIRLGLVNIWCFKTNATHSHKSNTKNYGNTQKSIFTWNYCKYCWKWHPSVWLHAWQYFPTLYHSLPSFLKNEMTTALQLSSSAKCCPPSQSFSLRNVWKSQSARSSEYIGCGKIDQWKSSDDLYSSSFTPHHFCLGRVVLASAECIYWYAKMYPASIARHNLIQKCLTFLMVLEQELKAHTHVISPMLINKFTQHPTSTNFCHL